jgi:hypothetical protein
MTYSTSRGSIVCVSRKEAMQTHPEMTEDVLQERERMEREKESLDHKQYPQQHDVNDVSESGSHNQTLNGDIDDNKTTTAIFNAKEVIEEVIQQIKSDITKVIKFLTPSPERQQMLREQQIKLRHFYKQHVLPTITEEIIPMLREQQIKLRQFYKHHILPTIKEEIIPSLKSLAVIIKDWGMTVVDMTRRYIEVTFMDKKEQRRGGGDDNVDNDDNDDDDDKTIPNQNNEQ